ncbi:MAG: thiol-disulfide oxidoreductase DCC family protein [Ignavibacteriaceae bacterium]
MNESHQIILFDGVCNFCNFWINFILKRDKEDKFRFAALQSKVGVEMQKKFSLDTNKLETVVLIIGNRYYTKSTAALLIIKQLNGFIKILFPLIILPKPIRDFGYDLIAKIRYKLFGEREFCRVPTEAEKNKFLS